MVINSVLFSLMFIHVPHYIGINTLRSFDCLFHVITLFNTSFTGANLSLLISESINSVKITASMIYNVASVKNTISFTYFVS